MTISLKGGLSLLQGTRFPLELICDFSKFPNTRLIYKNQVYFYILTMNQELQLKILFITASKIWNIGINLTTYMQDLYTKNYKAVASAVSDVTLWTVACQAPLSKGFSRQEYWSGLSWSPQGIFPPQGSKLSLLLSLLHWQVGSLPLVPPGKIIYRFN